MRIRSNFLKYLVFGIAVACAGSAWAGTGFRVKFVNDSYNKLEATIRDRADGKVVRRSNIDARDGENLSWDSRCNKTRELSFRLIELQTGSLVASGDFTVVAGDFTNGGYGCGKESFTWDSCGDSSGSDVYKATCSIIQADKDGRDRNGKVTIE